MDAHHRRWFTLLADLADDEVAALLSACRAELRDRAVRAGDPEEVANAAFSHAFGRDGLGIQPYVLDGLLVCPGSVQGTSPHRHTCRFVSVDDVWVWQHDDVLADVVTPDGDHSQRSVTVLPAEPGVEVDLVTSKKTMSGHQMHRCETFTVTADGLEHVGTRRKQPPSGHR